MNGRVDWRVVGGSWVGAGRVVGGCWVGGGRVLGRWWVGGGRIVGGVVVAVGLLELPRGSQGPARVASEKSVLFSSYEGPSGFLSSHC